jgi:hypothetical protein
LLSYFENVLTDYVVNELDNDFCFRWTGLDVEDQDKKYELRKTLLTLNELRAEEGYEKIDGVLGDAPVEASLLNAWMQLQAQQQPEGEDTPEGEMDNDDTDSQSGSLEADREGSGELNKSFSHHEGRQGQWGGSLPKQAIDIGDSSSIPPSSTIATYSQAHDYYQSNFGGKAFQMVVKTKSGDHDISVFFDRLNCHAYTRSAQEGELPDAWDNPKQQRGARVFDLQRAAAMDKLLLTLQKPMSVLGSYGRDVYISSAIGDDTYQVVILTVHTAKKCELATAYVCNKQDVNKLKATLRPVKPALIKKADSGLSAMAINFLGLTVDSDLLASKASALESHGNPPVHTVQVQASADTNIALYPHLVKSATDAPATLEGILSGDYRPDSPEQLLDLIEAATAQLPDSEPLLVKALDVWLEHYDDRIATPSLQAVALNG